MITPFRTLPVKAITMWHSCLIPRTFCAASPVGPDVFSDANRQQAVHKLSQRIWGKLLPADVEVLDHAAVLVPLCLVNGIPSVILTLRSSQLLQNRGQVSFPGGKADAADHDVINTALRETWEEIGVVPRSVDVWTQMKPSPFPLIGQKTGKHGEMKLVAKMSLTPVVGFLGEVDLKDLRISQEEVAKVFTRSLESLCHPDNARFTMFRTGAGYSLPVFLGGDHKIWGATALILHAMLDSLLPNVYKLRLKRPRVFQMKTSKKS